MGLASLAVVILALVASAPASAGGGDPSPVRPSTAAPASFTVELYERGDFVSQTNLVQCVGASMQMMMNMVGPENDRTPATQRRLWQLARSLHDPSTAGGFVRKGASARGWALALTQLGAGPYRVVALATLDEAMAVAARAMTSTHRPVGLLVWQGRHAWVLSGFEASADPTQDPEARVTAVRVLDPLYPRAGGAWGPTPAPNARLTTARLARAFVPWRPNSRNAAMRNRFVVVLPYEPSIILDAGRPA
jgi:hypothetical protein